MMTTEVKLTRSQYGILHSFALKTGKSEDQLVTEVVSKFIDDIGGKDFSETERRDAIRAAAGIWQDRDDLTDEFFSQLRRESDRNAGWSETKKNGGSTA